MAKFKKKSSKGQQSIPTSSLPDIIFMLLFFFLLTAKIREQEIKVKSRMPQATQIQKLERKSLVSYIYIGQPKETDKYGKEPRVQVNDVFVKPDFIPIFVEQERSELSEGEKDQLTMSLKVDKKTEMGIITDVKQKLRNANARKINYSSIAGEMDKY